MKSIPKHLILSVSYFDQLTDFIFFSIKLGKRGKKKNLVAWISATLKVTGLI